MLKIIPITWFFKPNSIQYKTFNQVLIANELLPICKIVYFEENELDIQLQESCLGCRVLSLAGYFYCVDFILFVKYLVYRELFEAALQFP